MNKKETLKGLKILLSFGVPGGRSAVQKRIGAYLDGNTEAIVEAPKVRAYIDEAVRLLGKEVLSQEVKECCRK